MIESCRDIMCCWVSSLTKIVTFFAGPLLNIESPLGSRSDNNAGGGYSSS